MFIEQFETANEISIDKEIRKCYKEKSVKEAGLRNTESEIKRLHALKNKDESNAWLSDEELKFGLKLAVENAIAVSKAFRMTASRYGHGKEWSKKVIRYRPKSWQVTRILNELEAESFFNFKGLEGYVHLDLKQLTGARDIRNMICKLKKLIKLAGFIREQRTEIALLKKELEKKDKLIAEQMAARKSTLLLSQEESIQALRNEFPEISVDGIAQSKCISRSSVYRHLAMRKA